MPRIGWYGMLAAAVLLTALAAPAFCQGRARLDGPVPVESTPTPEVAGQTGPPTQPITLPAALRLADARPIDIQLAQERLAVAAAQLQRAELLWLPTIYLGGAYFRHD